MNHLQKNEIERPAERSENAAVQSTLPSQTSQLSSKTTSKKPDVTNFKKLKLKIFYGTQTGKAKVHVRPDKVGTNAG